MSLLIAKVIGGILSTGGALTLSVYLIDRELFGSYDVVDIFATSVNVANSSETPVAKKTSKLLWI